MRLPWSIPTAAVLLAAAGTGCSESGGSDGLTVTSTASACDVSSTGLTPGTHTFSVTNKGDEETEVYVYGEGDKVIGEVEHIGPGTSRDLKVELAAGSYEVACKPGERGDGIRTPITVKD